MVTGLTAGFHKAAFQLITTEPNCWHWGRKSLSRIKMVNSSSGRVVTPYLKSVHVSSKHEIDIWFVPMRSGQFDFYCSLPGHQEAGMEGEVLIR